MPDIQKKNHNAATFEQARRRFKFNQIIEAVDQERPTQEEGRNSKGVFSRRRIFLTGMKAQPSPGPGTYKAPSEFGEYLSEKVWMSRSTHGGFE
jgi:hypothetical protein